MKKRNSLLWIDDDSTRKHKAKNLSHRLELKDDFFDFQLRSISEIKKHVTDHKDSIRLIAIDHFLDSSTKPILINRGASLAEVLREVITNVPIIGVTGDDNLKVVYSHSLSIYNELYPAEVLFDRPILCQLKSILSGFALLRRYKKRSVSSFLLLLRHPIEDETNIRAILPSELRLDKQYEDNQISFRIDDWIRHTLLKNPGFTYDSLWTATLMGLKMSSLKKVRKIIQPAQYKGIFANESDPRWWGSQLKSILSQYSTKDGPFHTWDLGILLPGITKRDHSVCYLCGERAPEIVAFIDSKRATRQPMHLKCTLVDEQAPKILFFEELRINKDAVI